MSRLFCTERGRVLLHTNEEITRWRWVRKVLTLPRAAAGREAELWLYVNMYDGNRAPLRILLNGKPAGVVKPHKKYDRFWWWISVPIRRGLLKAGTNVIELRADSSAMAGWMVGMENQPTLPKSFLSLDQGRTWQNRYMGAHGVLSGEYLVRLRVEGLPEAKLPRIVYENPKHPRLRELRERLPAAIRRETDPWKQLLSLRTWVARQWDHDPFGPSYCPWDPLTILDWSKRGWGHGRPGKVTMCVHYAVVFASFAAALGHKARMVAADPLPGKMNGHFMSEVWSDALNKWVMQDPNCDMHFEAGVPLSSIEIAQLSLRKQTLKPMARPGPGLPKIPRLVKFYNEDLLTGDTYLQTGIWTRNDVLENPQAQPPNHGSIAYCETDFVWFAPDQLDNSRQFPYRTADTAYFGVPPR